MNFFLTKTSLLIIFFLDREVNTAENVISVYFIFYEFLHFLKRIKKIFYDNLKTQKNESLTTKRIFESESSVNWLRRSRKILLSGII